MTNSIMSSEDTAINANKVLANKHFNDTFKSNSLDVFNFLSKDISPYLTDYFLLVDDFRIILQEESRNAYTDYGFVVVPVHKAFECYLSGFLSKFFGYKISQKRNESIGYYLAIENKLREEKINSLKESFKKYNIDLDTRKWLDAWEALKREWTSNRNPLTHSDGERITTLRQAESAANSIIREMQLSSDLFYKEFLNPIVETIKNQKEEAR